MIKTNQLVVSLVLSNDDRSSRLATRPLSIITIWLNKSNLNFLQNVGIMFVILRRLSLVNPRMAPKGLNGLVAHFLIRRNFVDFYEKNIRLFLWEHASSPQIMSVGHNIQTGISSYLSQWFALFHLFICLFGTMRDVHNFVMHKSHITCVGALQRSSV